MKGIVFTEFFEMVEKEFGEEMVETLIEGSDLSTDGAYTAVGTYDHGEMVSLAVNLHKKTGLSLGRSLNAFGKYLFKKFSIDYASFFEKAEDGFTFLEFIENYIHAEVQKLYNDAELSKFDTKRIGENQLGMIYTSQRKMADLAEGLIESSLEYFDLKASITRENAEEDGTVVNIITKE